MHRALSLTYSMVAALRRLEGVRRAEAAGSLRRRKETVGDVDLLVASVAPERTVEGFSR